MGRMTIGLVYAYYKGGSLWKYLKKTGIEWQKDGELTAGWTTLCGFARDIAAGVQFLHRNKVIHRDLAARNILLAERGARAVVGDIGFAKHDDVETDETVVSTRWAAPEVLEHGSSKYSQESDVWAFGVVIWEMLSQGEAPWPELTSRSVSRTKMLRHVTKYKHKCPKGTPKWMANILQSCFRRQPHKRARLSHTLSVIVAEHKE